MWYPQRPGRLRLTSSRPAKRPKEVRKPSGGREDDEGDQETRGRGHGGMGLRGVCPHQHHGQQEERPQRRESGDPRKGISGERPRPAPRLGAVYGPLTIGDVGQRIDRQGAEDQTGDEEYQIETARNQRPRRLKYPNETRSQEQRGENGDLEHTPHHHADHQSHHVKNHHHRPKPKRSDRSRSRAATRRSRRAQLGIP